MPLHRTTPLFSSGDLQLARVDCDGRDGPRVEEECIDGERVVIALRGRFAFHDRSARTVVGPGTALFLRAGHRFDISHPHGDGDASLSVRGGLARQLVAVGGTARPLTVAAYARLQTLLHGFFGGAADPLHVEETLCGALFHEGNSLGGRRDHAIAESIAYTVELRYDASLPLADLAAAAGVSVFHACRAFRRVMATTIHRHQQEIRLRHAVALLLDTRLPLARVALDCGFANQGHLGNAFRRRFGLTPGQARTTAGQRALGREKAPGT